MKAKYWQKGEALDFTATVAVKNGDIVSLNTRVGVAGDDIPAGSTGAVYVEGVFVMPKGAEEITLGATLYWNEESGNIVTDEAGNIPAGYATAPASAKDTTVRVKLLG